MPERRTSTSRRPSSVSSSSSSSRAPPSTTPVARHSRPDVISSQLDHLMLIDRVSKDEAVTTVPHYHQQQSSFSSSQIQTSSSRSRQESIPSLSSPTGKGGLSSPLSLPAVVMSDGDDGDRKIRKEALRNLGLKRRPSLGTSDSTDKAAVAPLEINGGIPTGAVARVREAASTELNASKGITPSTSSIVPPRPLVVGATKGGGSLQSRCLTEKDDVCAAHRAPCITCGGCRSTVRFSKLNEAGPEAAEIMRHEHCTCADRVSIRREVLKNYDAFIAAQKAKADIVRSQNQALDPEEIAKAVAARRRKSSVAKPSKEESSTEPQKAEVQPSPAESIAVVGEGEDAQKRQLNSKLAVKPGRKRALPTSSSAAPPIKGATGAGGVAPPPPPPPPKTDVVLRERTNIQGAHVQVIMHQLDDELWVEALDTKSGESFEARTKLSKAYMESKTGQQQTEIYKQILLHQLAFKKDVVEGVGLAGDEGPNSIPPEATSSSITKDAGPRYMNKDGRKRRLVIVINTPAPPGARRSQMAIKRRLARGSPLMYEIMTIDGSAYSVKAVLEGSDVIFSFNHQIYRSESYLILPAVAMPLLARLRNVDPKDRNRRHILGELQRLLAEAKGGGGTAQKQSNEETISSSSVKRLVQHSVAFKRVEADLVFTLEPILKSDAGDLFNHLALLQISATAIQAHYRGYTTRRQVKLWRIRVNKAAIQIQRMVRGYLARVEYNRVCRRLGRKEKLRRSSIKGQLMVTKVQCLIRMWLAARRAKARLAASSSSPGSTVDDAGYNSKDRKAKELLALRQRAQKREADKKEKERNAAAITIQCAMRSHLARMEVMKRKEQRQALMQENENRVALLQLQQNQQKAAIVIQSSVRRHNAKAELLRRRQQASLQKQKEKEKEKKKAEAEAKAKAQEEEKAAINHQRHAAATIIQCTGRRYLAKKELKARRLEEAERQKADERQRQILLQQQQQQERAAIITQCTGRRYLAKKELKARQSSQQARRLEEAERQKAEEEERQLLLQQQQQQQQQERAAVIIQCTGRRYLAKKELKARQSSQQARRLEEAERQKAEEEERQILLQQQQEKAAISIQCASRNYLARQELKRRQLGKLEVEAKLLQQQEEKEKQKQLLLLLQEQQLQLQRQEAAAIIIQCAYRSHLARKEIKRRQAAAYEAKQQQLKEEEEARDRKNKQASAAATTIQCAFRCHLARKTVYACRQAAQAELLRLHQQQQQQNDAALILQCSIRSHLARKHVMQKREEKRLIQIAKVEKERAAVVCIQCCIRNHLARAELTRRREARARELLLLQEQEKQTKLEKQKIEAAIVIQCAIRSHWARLEVHKRRQVHHQKQQEKEKKENAAALVIQCAVRCHFAKKEVAYRQARVYEQKAMKAQISLRQAQEDVCAVAIQRIIRGYLGRCRCKKLKEVKQWRQHRLHLLRISRIVIMIQRAFRRHSAQLHVQQWEAWWAWQSQCATAIQRVWRGHYVRYVIMPLRRYERQQEELEAQWDRWNVEQSSATAIQAFARGHLARNRVNAIRAEREAARRKSSTQLPPPPEAFELVEEELVDEMHDGLDAGALDPNTRDALGKTLFMSAAEKGNTHLMELLLFYGADPNAQDYEDGNTALHFAKQAEMDDAVEWLINVAQADDQIKNYQGHTCYFYGL